VGCAQRRTRRLLRRARPGVDDLVIQASSNAVQRAPLDAMSAVWHSVLLPDLLAKPAAVEPERTHCLSPLMYGQWVGTIFHLPVVRMKNSLRLQGFGSKRNRLVFP
jgi:hypothetical protein